jgi:hypothetical protein
MKRFVAAGKATAPKLALKTFSANRRKIQADESTWQSLDDED